MLRRISLLVVVTTSTVVVSFVVPLCLLVRTLAENRAIAAADQEARNVAILVAGVGDDPQLPDLVAAVDRRGTPTTDVLTADGTQIGDGPPMRSDPDVARALDGEGFTEIDSDGGEVLIPVIGPAGTTVVRTTVTADQLHTGVLGSWAGIVGLGLVLLAGGVAIAWRLGRRISEPLLEVAGTAHRLREGDLTARAEVRGTEETRELARALNGLAERTEELLATEHAAVGDLSHRLRTPVTALRLDAETVDDADVAERLQEHIAVLQRTIDAIVKEARRPVRGDLAARCDAATTVATRVAFWRALAEDQDRPLETRLAAGPLQVGLAEDDLTDVVDVLVDNVFAHTPVGTPFRVLLAHDHDACRLVVSDDGPGLPRQRQRDRPGTSGLGLDIVRRAATAAGGTATVGRSTAGGVEVTVQLPLRE